MEIEGDAFENAMTTEIGHRENKILSRRRRSRLRQIDLTADHVCDRALRRRLEARARRYSPPVAKDRDLVGDLEHFLDTMADKENRDALPLQIADKPEQLLNLMGGERRRRLVHDEDANVERDRLGDFDRLLGGERQAARRVSHVERDAKLGEDRLGLAKRLSPVDHCAAVLVADENVLGDVEIGKQQRLLIDGGDAQSLRLGGAAYRDGSTGEKDLAAIRLMHAGDDLDERRFAGAVLAEQGVNFAGMQRKRDVFERLSGVEALGDAANLQDRRNPSPRRRRFLPARPCRQRPPAMSMIAPVT